MKTKTFLAIATASALILASCGDGTTTQTTATSSEAIATTADNVTSTKDVGPLTQKVSFEGEIDHTEWTGGVEATVTFERFPQTLEQFESDLQQLGKEPQGAVVLQLMAMELYRNDEEAGTRALEIINTPTNLPSTLRLLKQKVRPTDPNDSYARPYLVASNIQGATPENGYNPPRPFKVKVRTTPNHKYEKSNLLKGYVLYLQVYNSGHEVTPWLGVEVVKCKGDDYYRVANCPSILTQCKEIDWESDAEFQGLY